MKSKGYEYQRQDLEYGGIFSPIAQYMILDDNIIVDGIQYIFYNTDIIIYSYENNEEMEKEAITLNKEASQIVRDGNTISMEFSEANPHFYKKGKIIVQYIGNDEKILKDLQGIMGEQFAGIK